MTDATAAPSRPPFSELDVRSDGAPAGAAWGVIGDDDEVGTINLLGSDRVLAGVAEVRLGEVHPLNWRVDRPRHNAYRRAPKRVHLGAGNTFGRDDYIDRFFLQYSTQWDGLRHIVTSDERFYNGRAPEQVDADGSEVLGIQVWAERGIAGRGVLLDVARFLEGRGTPLDPRSNTSIGADILDATAHEQGVSIEVGDILLVRTGWVGWYESLDPDDQDAASNDAPQPGVEPGRATAAWLWDRGIAAVAADNMSFEAYPIDEGPDSLHRLLIPGFGMPIGEYFWLDGLAEACVRDRRWSFLFTSAPLNVAGGVGSPPNALALR
jgi:kynurenine formamidase